MQIFTELTEWQRARQTSGFVGRSIGFVPTMGALHRGHRSLLERARAENDRVVLSIFVNPTQFDDPADLKRYPRDLDSDVALAEGLVDAILLPDAGQLYADHYRYRVTEDELSSRWEGEHRPGHFDGVLTVVLKLLNLVQANRAYFGEKDWQQLQLVRGMAQALFLPVEIVACVTERTGEGLALSSRNQRLSPEALAQAPAFSQILRESATAEAATTALRALGFAVDYVADHENVRLGAVRIEGVRLLDNVRR